MKIFRECTKFSWFFCKKKSGKGNNASKRQNRKSNKQNDSKSVFRAKAWHMRRRCSALATHRDKFLKPAVVIRFSAVLLREEIPGCVQESTNWPTKVSSHWLLNKLRLFQFPWNVKWLNNFYRTSPAGAHIQFLKWLKHLSVFWPQSNPHNGELSREIGKGLSYR